MTNQGLAFFEDRGVVEVQEPWAWVPLEEGGTVEVKGLSGRYFQATEDMELEHEVIVLLDRNGKREWIMHGDTASYRHAEKAFYISALHGTLYSSADRGSRPGEDAEIRGESGRYDIAGRTMRLEKGVSCQWSKGVTLETDKLNYSLDTQTASTEAKVLIRGQGFRLQGQGLQADMEGKNVVIPNAVNLRLDQGMRGIK
jgi:LPS export ABC transporter protein LptC